VSFLESNVYEALKEELWHKESSYLDEFEEWFSEGG